MMSVYGLNASAAIIPRSAKIAARSGSASWTGIALAEQRPLARRKLAWIDHDEIRRGTCGHYARTQTRRTCNRESDLRLHLHFGAIPRYQPSRRIGEQLHAGD